MESSSTRATGCGSARGRETAHSGATGHRRRGCASELASEPYAEAFQCERQCVSARIVLRATVVPRSDACRLDDLRKVELMPPVPWQVYLTSPPVPQMTHATRRLADALLD